MIIYQYHSKQGVNNRETAFGEEGRYMRVLSVLSIRFFSGNLNRNVLENKVLQRKKMYMEMFKET